MFVMKNTSFVMTKVCHNKMMFVVTEYFCCDKSFVMTNICLLKTCLSWQKICHDKLTFVETKYVFCCDKHAFAVTKMILVAAPTNDGWGGGGRGIGGNSQRRSVVYTASDFNSLTHELFGIFGS